MKYKFALHYGQIRIKTTVWSLAEITTFSPTAEFIVIEEQRLKPGQIAQLARDRSCQEHTRFAQESNTYNYLEILNKITANAKQNMAMYRVNNLLP